MYRELTLKISIKSEQDNNIYSSKLSRDLEKQISESVTRFLGGLVPSGHKGYSTIYHRPTEIEVKIDAEFITSINKKRG